MLRRDFLYASALVAGTNLSGASGPLTASKSILDYGAKPDGKTLNTQAIQRAIDDISGAGGGTVYAPPGSLLVGGLELKSSVTLYLEAGCVLLGSTSMADYAISSGSPYARRRQRSPSCFSHSKAEDASLCGPRAPSTDKGKRSWQPKVDRAPVSPNANGENVSFTRYDTREDNNLRPSPMVEFAECT